jgi:hypothetical protein
MSAVLPHYKQGPMNKQVSALVIGGMIVCPTTIGSNTDLTVAPCSAANARYYMGVAGKDANVIAVQTGAVNTYGQPAIDISVLDDYTSVYYGMVDIWVWYQGAVSEGDFLTISGTTAGTVVTGGATPAVVSTVGKCTHPGGIVSGMLTANTLIGGSTYFLGRARIF